MIHTAGPVWSGSFKVEPRAGVVISQRWSWRANMTSGRSRSRPISCGLYGYPLELAAAVAVGTAFLETNGELRQVLLVGFGTVVTGALRAR